MSICYCQAHIARYLKIINNVSFLVQCSMYKKIIVEFYKTPAGNEPVKEWLRGLKPVDDRKSIGADLKTVEVG